MSNISSVASGVGKASGGLFSKLLKVKWSYYFIVILFIQALVVGYSNGGGVEIIRALGERFFNMTNEIQEISLKIIDSGAVFNGYLDLFKQFWNLFSNIWLIYLWLKLFFWAFGKSPFSNESEGFKNISFSIITFFILQIFYLMLFTTGKSNIELFMLPFDAFKDLFKALVLIFESVDIDTGITSSLTNICTNPSGCVI